MKNIRRQLGFTMIELLIAIPVVTLASITAVKAYNNYAATQLAYEYGTGLNPVINAVQGYAQTYWQNLQANTPITLSDGSTVANIYVPTVAELKKLPTAPLASWFNPNLNLMDAVPVISLAVSPAGCTATNAANCDIQGSVYWSRPFINSDGRASVNRASQAASQIPSGGFSSYANTAMITAVDNSWSIPNPLNTPAVVGSFFSMATSGNQIYIKVGDNRNPNLRGALTVQGSMTTNSSLTVAGNQSVGGDSTVTGKITAAAGRAILWTQPAEGGVLTLKDASGQQMHQELLGGRMRWINGGWTADLGGIDQGGNLSTAGAISAGGAITSNQAIISRDTISATNTIRTDSTVVPGWAVETWGCETGAVGKAAYTVTDGWAYNGKPLSCQNGVWAKSGGLTPNYAASWWHNPGCGYGGDCGCPAGTIMTGTYGWWSTYTDAWYYCTPLQ